MDRHRKQEAVPDHRQSACAWHAWQLKAKTNFFPLTLLSPLSASHAHAHKRHNTSDQGVPRKRKQEGRAGGWHGSEVDREIGGKKEGKRVTRTGLTNTTEVSYLACSPHGTRRQNGRAGEAEAFCQPTAVRHHWALRTISFWPSPTGILPAGRLSWCVREMLRGIARRIGQLSSELCRDSPDDDQQWGHIGCQPSLLGSLHWTAAPRNS